ncbi:Lrp/AsnC family transcriptional regulator [Pseudomonas sp. MYb185]|uniref:siroheme decarboxylase subunit beta n=1 Tax=Pseudomonas sp. MYb185 TaxID=1848729 RepID=UPI000CFABC03|nr:Lrp/AsnC family transcriptional regulator [Pseudomonas sp. MYb185]PRB82903.1 AsnC family protein [Pseudomonas sp. MYb185]
MTGLCASQQLALRRQLERGLPLTTRPYRHIAEQLGASEQAVLDQVNQWNTEGLFRRFGLVVHHRALGFRANAMLVLDIPDQAVDAIGEQLSSAPGINLCYQRPRRLPHWPFNLFCMVHGRERAAVQAHIERLLERYELDHLPHRLLFSTRAFKQRGGRFTPAAEVAHG